MSPFQKAERKKAKLRLALIGPSGCGKTYSALKIAQGLGGNIAMIDTERYSGELYSDMLNYDVAPLEPPFSPQRYTVLINEAYKNGYNVLIIDSVSHAWAGEGGLLDMHDKATAASRSKNSYMAWREVTPEHNRLVDTILQADLHVITTFRTKTAYEIQDQDGKKTPVKVGLSPIFRDGIEYEMTVCLDMSIEGHIATSSKDRTSLFDGQHFIPSKETGETLLKWLNGGIDAPKKPLLTPQSVNIKNNQEPKPSALEEFQIVAGKLWPSKSAEDKNHRGDFMETVFGTRSWTAVTEKPLEILENVKAKLRAFEKAYSDMQKPDISMAWDFIQQKDDDIPDFPSQEAQDAPDSATSQEDGGDSIPKYNIPDKIPWTGKATMIVMLKELQEKEPIYFQSQTIPHEIDLDKLNALGSLNEEQAWNFYKDVLKAANEGGEFA